MGRREGRRSGPAERRGGRHRADHGRQGARRRPTHRPPAISSPTRSCARRCSPCPATGRSWSARTPPPTTRATARTCTRTPPARSPVRWPRAAASTHSDSPTAGTAPTACSARALRTRRRVYPQRGLTDASILHGVVSWEYPPVVIGGLGRHVHHLATALAAAGHEVVVLSRRPSGTDPSTHPSTDEIAEGVRVVAAAQDPHEFDFGADMMAWTLAMGHSMVRAGLALGLTQPAVAARRRARPRLAGRPPRDRAGRILRCPTGFHDPRHRGRQAFGLGFRSRSAARCTRWNRGWFTNPIRSSHVRRR